MKHNKMKIAAVSVAVAAAAGLAFAQSAQPVIGLITKTETNPFFVKMKEGAQKAATAGGAKLLSGAGKTDGDNAGQAALLRPGAWHWAPYPLSETATFLLILRAETSEHDVEMRDVPAHRLEPPAHEGPSSPGPSP